VGVANAPRDTSCPVSRNENDSPGVAAKTASRPRNQAARFAKSGKVLKLRTDSKSTTAVTFPTIAQNKFIICLLLNRAETNFRTTDRRYADK
jgi:hypothetical protein